MYSNFEDMPRENVISIPFAEKIAPSFFAALLGVALLFAAGFAESDILHTAAHDSRHSVITPCH